MENSCSYFLDIVNYVSEYTVDSLTALNTNFREVQVDQEIKCSTNEKFHINLYPPRQTPKLYIHEYVGFPKSTKIGTQTNY